jgi:hypothetical protein
VTVVDEIEAEAPLGEVPDMDHEVFREQLPRAARQDPDEGAHVTLHDEASTSPTSTASTPKTSNSRASHCATV